MYRQKFLFDAASCYWTCKYLSTCSSRWGETFVTTRYQCHLSKNTLTLSTWIKVTGTLRCVGWCQVWEPDGTVATQLKQNWAELWPVCGRSDGFYDFFKLLVAAVFSWLFAASVKNSIFSCLFYFFALPSSSSSSSSHRAVGANRGGFGSDQLWHEGGWEKPDRPGEVLRPLHLWEVGAGVFSVK